MNQKQLYKKWYSNENYYNDEEVKNLKDEHGHTADIINVYSGRNRGKSFTISSKAIAEAYYSKGKKKFGLIRRYDKELTSDNILSYFEDKKEFIKDLTNGECEYIISAQRRLYLASKEEKNGKIVYVQKYEVGKAFSLSMSNQYKSLQYPDIYTLIFEEVLTKDAYIKDEPQALLSIISTIKRSKTGFVCWLISNTVTRVNPYTQAYAIDLIHQKSGTIKCSKLYLGEYDENGNEKYMLIVSQYLADRDEQMAKKDTKKQAIVANINSNAWEENHMYPVVDFRECQKYISYHPNDVAVATYDAFSFIICVVDFPLDIINGNEEVDENNTMPLLYIQRKTGNVKEGTRVYDNSTRYIHPLKTNSFMHLYNIDETIFEYICRGWYAFTDNLTGNDFFKVWEKLQTSGWL